MLVSWFWSKDVIRGLAIIVPRTASLSRGGSNSSRCYRCSSESSVVFMGVGIGVNRVFEMACS